MDEQDYVFSSCQQRNSATAVSDDPVNPCELFFVFEN